MRTTITRWLYRLLRRSERYTRTDMVYLAKGGSWLTLARGVSVVAGVALSVAFANLIPPEVYGQYRYVLAVAGIIGAFTLTGMNASVVVAVSRGFTGTFAHGARALFRWSSLASGMALAAAAYYFFNENQLLGWSLVLIAIATPLTSTFRLNRSYLKAQKRFRGVALFDTCEKLFLIAGLVSALVISDNALILIATYLTIEVVVNALFFLVSWRERDPHAPIESGAVNFAKHLSVMEGAKRIVAHLDKIIVFQLLGAAPLALYAFARTPITELQSIDKVVAGLALPKLGTRTPAELRRTLPRKVGLLMLAMAALAGCYVLAAPYLFAFLFPLYTDAVPYTQVLALTLVLAPQALFVNALVAHERTKHLYLYRLLGPTAKVAVLLIGVPLLGIWGAVTAALTGRMVGFILSTALFWLAFRSPR
ncbi:oligosaccharide flippase family protein [Patescibacteria group bacterium]|jgi:O-antigen/teichoic acid export membrane protein|nr:oligosaccharide flippase family protein [Patescibacteria group bacterium]